MSEAEQVKLCKDCKHYMEESGINRATMETLTFHRCNQIPTHIDRVTGVHYRTNLDCYKMREEHGNCGPSGRLWEAK